MLVVLARILAAVCAACLLLAAVWFFVLVLLFLPLQAPSALDACAEPCFGPPASNGDVAEGTAFGAVAAAICAGLGATGLALLFKAVGMPWPRRRRLLLSPVIAAGMVVFAVGVAQAIEAL